MPTIDVTLPRLHKSQQRVRDCQARYRVLAAGRRWGKTLLGAALCIETALRGGRAWWVAPSYKMGRVGWRAISRLARQLPGADVKRGERMITLPTGGEVWVRSADDPQSLRGEGLDLAVLDECAYMHADAWTEALRPALSDRRGRALMISTPKGRNWFWRAYQRGVSGEPDWAAFRLPTADNPHIDPAEIDAARRELPERIFRQEYLAEFLDDAGGVFRRVLDAVAPVQPEPLAGREYVVGVDWGRSNDATAIAVMDVAERALVHMERMTGTEYARQLDALRGLYQTYNPRTILAERNSMGGPLVEQLQRDGLPVVGYTTTNATKSEIIDALALAFERGEITIPADDVLIGELQAYEGRRLASGMMRYSAPPGMHDDTVIALALAWHAAAGRDALRVGW